MDQDTLDRVPANARPGLEKMNANASFASRSSEERHHIIQNTLERALNDEHLAEIAESFNLPRSVLNYNLLANACDEWRDTQVARAMTAKQVAQEAMDTAVDGLALAKAREQLKSAQWELEKLLRRLYGDDKTAINVNAAGQVSIQVVNYSGSDSGSESAIDAPQQVQCSMDSEIIEGEKV